jgi:hypothetical protein
MTVIKAVRVGTIENRGEGFLQSNLNNFVL